MSAFSRYAVFAVVAVLAAGLGILVGRCSMTAQPPEQALLLESPRALPAFSLVDHHGKLFDPERLNGHWTFMFFGFTHCPDVCPATLFTLGQVKGQLGDLPQQQRPAVIMVSVDPNRDTPEKLANYVPYFDPGFVGVTGEMPQIMSLTQAMGVAFTYTPIANDTNGYAVDHTASIFLVDPAGRLAAIFGTPHEADRIARDYRRIMETRK